MARTSYEDTSVSEGEGRELYKPGDIGRIKATGLMSRLATKAMNFIFTPKAGGFHHFVIRGSIPDEDDYEIMESISSGIRLGRLSWYKDYEVFRLGIAEAVEKGEMACRNCLISSSLSSDNSFFRIYLLLYLSAYLSIINTKVDFVNSCQR